MKDTTYKGLIFSDGAGRKCIHGTDPTHPYVVVFVNDRGVVGVKSPSEYGGEATTRVRCITWDVLTGDLANDDYDALIEQGWERKAGETHTSVRLGTGTTVCECCGQAISLDEDYDPDYELEDRIQEAIAFLDQ